MNPALSRHGSTSELIRTVAGTLFCQAGYSGTGMRSLAAAVGIQPGSLYNHIESKQALLFELISEHELHLLQIFRGLSTCMDAVQMNALLWEKVSAYMATHRHLAQLARDQIQHLSAAQADAICGVRQRRQRQLQALLSHCSADLGLSEEGLKTLSQELDALLNGYISVCADATVDVNGTLKRQLHNMARMLLVKRD